MRAFLAVLGDSVRLLRARALFWIALGISGLVALLYLSIGFDEKGVSVLFGAFHFENELLVKGSKGAEMLYVGVFRSFIVGIWLTWAATIIALISCAPIFPEFLSEGASGVALSKPVSRLALFCYKYLGSLLFVAFQSTLFVGIVFFAIRWRLGAWNPAVLWAIPLSVLLFSYLYSVTVWIGIRTRSSLAAIFLTILLWLGCFLAQWTEGYSYAKTEHGMDPFTRRKLSESQREGAAESHQWMRIPYLILPKTGDTIGLLDRWIVLRTGASLGESAAEEASRMSEDESVGESAKKDLVRHSTGFVIGTSLAFEFAILGLAAWRFNRRDY